MLFEYMSKSGPVNNTTVSDSFWEIFNSQKFTHHKKLKTKCFAALPMEMQKSHTAPSDVIVQWKPFKESNLGCGENRVLWAQRLRPVPGTGGAHLHPFSGMGSRAPLSLLLLVSSSEAALTVLLPLLPLSGWTQISLTESSTLWAPFWTSIAALRQLSVGLVLSFLQVAFTQIKL